MENWKPIAGYEGVYEISDLGRVRSLTRRDGRGCVRKGKIRKQKTSKGYKLVTLCLDGTLKTFRVHRLVAEAFIQKPVECNEVNHKDENKSNNSVSNLEWVTHIDNVRYGTGNNRRIKHLKKSGAKRMMKPVAQYDLRGVLIAEFAGIRVASRCSGIDASHISKCCRGLIAQTGGYKWTFARK